MTCTRKADGNCTLWDARAHTRDGCRRAVSRPSRMAECVRQEGLRLCSAMRKDCIRCARQSFALDKCRFGTLSETKMFGDWGGWSERACRARDDEGGYPRNLLPAEPYGARSAAARQQPHDHWSICSSSESCHRVRIRQHHPSHLSKSASQTRRAGRVYFVLRQVLG